MSTQPGAIAVKNIFLVHYLTSRFALRFAGWVHLGDGRYLPLMAPVKSTSPDDGVSIAA